MLTVGKDGSIVASNDLVDSRDVICREKKMICNTLIIWHIRGSIFPLRIIGDFAKKESLLTVSNNVTIKKKLEVMWRVIMQMQESSVTVYLVAYCGNC